MGRAGGGVRRLDRVWYYHHRTDYLGGGLLGLRGIEPPRREIVNFTLTGNRIFNLTSSAPYSGLVHGFC